MSIERFYLNNVLDFSEYPDESIACHFDKVTNRHVFVIDLRNFSGTMLEQQIKDYLKFIVSEGCLNKKMGRRVWFNSLNTCLLYLASQGIDNVLDIDSNFLAKYSSFLDLENEPENSNPNMQYLLIIRILNITLSMMSIDEQLSHNRLIPPKDIHDKIVWTRCNILFLDNLLMPIRNHIKNLIYELNNQTNLDLCRNTLYAYISPLRVLIDYLVTNRISNIDCLEIDDYKNYLYEHGINVTHNGKSTKYITILNKLNIIIDKTNSDSFFDMDYWDLSQLNLEECRYTNFSAKPTLRFNDIENNQNKSIVKIYIKHLVTLTSNTCSTIVNKLRIIKNVCKNISTPLIIAERIELWNYIEKISDNEKSKTLSCLREFYKIMLIKHVITNSPILSYDFINLDHAHKHRSIPEHITNQIFEHLNTLEEEIALVFLIIYCTGLRISEAVSIKYDCLECINDVYYLKSSSYKMKKEQSNVIPKILYERLLTYIKDNKDDSFSLYVFKTKIRDWSKQDMCLSETYFREKIKEFITLNNIVDEEGKLYSLDVHGYRHSIATEMSNMGLPLFVIQKTLHHKSIEMTMAYIDIDNKRLKNEYDNMISINGKKLEFNYDNEKVIIEYLKKGINAQALPNGICALPTKLSKCPHANSCLTCNYFGTNKNYLSILIQQRKDTKELLDVAIDNGWEMQIETNKEVLTNLDRIIEELENEQCN